MRNPALTLQWISSKASGLERIIKKVGLIVFPSYSPLIKGQTAARHLCIKRAFPPWPMWLLRWYEKTGEAKLCREFLFPNNNIE